MFWQHFFEGLLVYLGASVFLFYLRLSSFLYFAALYDVPPVTLQDFLNRPQLRFSLMRRLLSGEELYSLWERSNRNIIAEQRRTRFGIVPFAVICALLIAAPIIAGDLSNPSEVIPALFWLIVFAGTFVYSWRFGHSLKDIKSINQRES